MCFPVNLYNKYIVSLKEMRYSTLAHEAAHFGLNLRGDYTGGESQTAAFSRSNPNLAPQNADNWAFAFGFTRDDD